MPLVTFKEIMPLLDERKVCLPAIDIAGGHPDFLLGALRACEEENSPALLIVYTPAAKYVGLEACTKLVHHFAESSPVPVVLHLDHGKEEELVERALDLGFTSVMFDGSSEPLEENIRRTKAMVELAHSRGVLLEGELGKIGAELDGKGADGLTDPGEAERFVNETGVDLLAPAIGNKHGMYDKPPALQFDLIEEIRERTGIALSLHGGTGIPLEDVRRSGELGMRKMNVATQIHKTYGEAIDATPIGDTNRQYNWRDMLSAGRDAITEKVAWYLRETGAAGSLD
jgi:fructose-bisphosphate aldolase class II